MEKENTNNKKKKIAVIAVAAVLALCVLGAGGYGIWRAVTAPKSAVDLGSITQSDVDALFRQKNKRKSNLPAGLETLLQLPEEEKIAGNGNMYEEVIIPEVAQELYEGQSLFSEREWLLTDAETYDVLHTEKALQRDMQVRALIKLALTQNCERVRYSVEYVELPAEGEAATLAAYIAANGGQGKVRGEGGYTFEFSSAWASRTIGRDIKTVAADKASFDAFMKELETYEPVDALVLPGAGRN